MNYIKTKIPGVIILEPVVHKDARGYFMETFSKGDFERNVRPVDFVQDNESHSCRGVVRGLHFQKMPYAQSKLVRCIEGCVLDVAVDLRSDSPTYRQWVAVELSAGNKRQLFLPRGMAHGFAVLSREATFVYKCDSYYHPESEGGVNPFDPELGIDWQISSTEAILSPKDTTRPCLKDIKNLDKTFNGNLYEAI